jgi:hypothetical protein
LEKTHIVPLANNKKPIDYWSLSGILLVACISFLYVLTAGTNGVPLITNVSTSDYFSVIRDSDIYPEFGREHYGYYNLLADAFLSRHLYLPIEPDPKLLELDNPYDAKANAPYRLHDASLKNGHFYFYFGPVPALLLFSPFRILGIGMMSEPLACSILYILILILSYEMVCTLCGKSGIKPGWWNPFAAITIGLGGNALFILRRPVVYEVAILSGCVLALLAIRFLIEYLLAKSGSKWLIFITGAFISLSMGCRPNSIILAPVAGLCLLIFLFKKKPRPTYATIFGVLCILAIPIIVGGALLLLYNYQRYGQALEFGMNLQLTAVGAPNVAFSKKTSFLTHFIADPNLIISNLIYYFIIPPKIQDIFPFISAAQDRLFLGDIKLHGVDSMVGFLISCPIIPIGIILIIINIFLSNKRYILFIAILPSLFGFASLIGLSILFTNATMRYFGDFLPLIIISSVMGCIFIITISNKFLKILLFPVIWIFLIFCSTINIAIGQTGYYDLFRRGEPELYYRIEDFLQPIADKFFVLNKPKTLEFIGSTLPVGSIRLDDGSEAIWVNRKGVNFRFYSPTSSKLRITANLLVRQDNPVVFEFKAPDGTKKSMLQAGISRKEFEFPIREGINRIAFYARPMKNSETSEIALYPALLRDIQFSEIDSK